MPEGHSIHRLARQFNSVFANHRLAVSSPQGRFVSGAALLDGQRLVDAEAHGKQLFLHFGNDLYLRVHLGLYGAWDFGGDETFQGASSIGAPRRIGEREIPGPARVDPDQPPAAAAAAGGSVASAYGGPPDPVGAVRIRLVSGHGWADLRGPSACEVLTEAEAAAVVGKLGPDPLQTEALSFDRAPQREPAADFSRRIRAKGSPIGVLLMTQQIVAGVGNVYRAEVLFRQRLNP